MNTVARISESLPDFSTRQLSLIKRTVATDTNDDEFNLFIEVARRSGLDPFRRQISALVFSKGNADKRRMAIVVGIDGQRVLAQRSGNYRPATDPPAFEIDPAAKGDSNPLGLVACRVRLWQQDNKGDWHAVAGEAFWDEFVVLKDDADEWEWIDTGEVWEDTGKPKKKKKAKGNLRRVPSDNWQRMPRLMLAKVATMQALRAGWPDQFAGLYGEEEMERAQALDVDATDALARETEERRLRAVGGRDALTVDWLNNGPLESVPVGSFADRAMAFIRENKDEPSTLKVFRDRNKSALQNFWARQPTDALELKAAFEKAELVQS